MRLFKRITCFAIIYFTLILLIQNCYSYSDGNYSIDVPNTYTIYPNNYFQKETGENFNINLVSIANLDTQNFRYNQTNLNAIVEELEKQLQTTTYPYNIIEKEITKFSKNNYKCFHIITSVIVDQQVVYSEQYAIGSGEYIYILTITAGTQEYFDTEEVKKIVNSFTINDFNSIEGTSVFEKAVIVAISVIILLGGYNLIIYIKNKKKLNNK